jgi:hypothetical protein
MLILRHVYQNPHKKSIIHNLIILSDEKLRNDIGFNLKTPQVLYLVLRRSDVDSPEGQKWPMIQLKLRSTTANHAEIFTRGVSLQGHSSLKFSAQKTHSKWEIISEGEGPLKSGSDLNETMNEIFWFLKENKYQSILLW